VHDRRVHPGPSPRALAQAGTPRAAGTASATRATARAEAALGAVVGAMVAGEARPQQLEMCRAVAHAIETGRHLVVQAGTGTGKSLAYLLAAVTSGRRVVVATATKALQDQLAGKDLPAAHAAVPFTHAVLKGRANYLCRQRLEELGTPVATPGPPDAAGPVPSGLAAELHRVLAWAEETETGDRADLPFEPSERAWSLLSVGPRECPGAFRCPSGGRCFAERARALAADADVVVVNTHLYGAHLASGGAVLPPHEVVVFDEAHEVEEIMTASLGVELTPGRLRSLAALARPVLSAAPGNEDAPALDRLTEVADRLQQVLAERVGTRVLQAADEEPGRPAPDRGAGLDGQLAPLLELGSTRVRDVLDRLRHSEQESSLFPDEAVTGRRGRALSAASHLVDDLTRLTGPADGEVAWVDGARRSPVLRLSPVDVAPALSRSLWGEVTAVLTSATIPLRLVERLGIPAGSVDRLDVGSPFDFRSHALLYVARHLPDRRSPRADAALHAELEHLVRAAGGRTLALFTSHRATAAAAEALADRLPFRLLVQGDLPKARLLEVFAAEESSCLFATLGFWQGVDVPGRALSLVTLDRLPFGRPDDPLLEARRERAGDAAFALVDLPRAAALLAQGAGRLIRSTSDRGVVAVLDPRLAVAGYRGVLLAALPPMRRTTDRRQVEDFLRRALSAEGR